MHYTFTTPPASRAAERPAPIDDMLVADARRLLGAAMANRPPEGQLDRHGMRALFAAPMRTLCADSTPDLPVEKLIVAIKLGTPLQTLADVIHPFPAFNRVLGQGLEQLAAKAAQPLEVI